MLQFGNKIQVWHLSVFFCAAVKFGVLVGREGNIVNLHSNSFATEFELSFFFFLGRGRVGGENHVEFLLVCFVLDFLLKCC